MNIDGYRKSVHEGLRRLEEVIAKANDIVDNRIVKNLRDISRAVLVDMPRVSRHRMDFGLFAERNSTFSIF